MSRLADSSFLFALFDHADDRRPLALRWAEDPAAIEIVPEVLGETLGVTQRRPGFSAAREIYFALRSKPHIRFVESPGASKIEEEFEAAKGSLTWTDAAVVAAARTMGREVLCFDPRLRRRAA